MAWVERGEIAEWLGETRNKLAHANTRRLMGGGTREGKSSSRKQRAGGLWGGRRVSGAVVEGDALDVRRGADGGCGGGRGCSWGPAASSAACCERMLAETAASPGAACDEAPRAGELLASSEQG